MNESNEITEKEKLLKEISSDVYSILLMLIGILFGLSLMCGFIFYLIFKV